MSGRVSFLDDIMIWSKESYEISRKADEYAINKHLENWKDFFVLSEGFFDFSHELGVSLAEYTLEPNKSLFLFLLLKIHEKSTKVFKEMIILLQYGSASGAFARWRVLYEFSVVSSILDKFPELSQNYFDSLIVADYKYTRKHVKYMDRLKHVGFQEEDLSEVSRKYQELKKSAKFDVTKDYGWAKNEEIRNPNLFELAKNVQLEHLYAYVDEAHIYNHSSSRYLLSDRGAKNPKNDKESFLFSPFELNLPMQLMFISLNTVNMVLIKNFMKKEDELELMLNYLSLSDDFCTMIVQLTKARIEKNQAL